MNKPLRAQVTLLGWLAQAQWREHPASLLTASLSIAIGIALALGIHLVNRSALAQFTSAIALVNGEAQAQILPRAGLLDEMLFDQLERHPEIAAASPVIELKAQARAENQPADWLSLRVIAVDPMRAARVTPALLPSLGESGRTDPTAVFADDAIFLSRAALRELAATVGDTIIVSSADRGVRWRIAGILEGAGDGQMLATVDLANAQEYFGLAGRLTRIDLRFRSDTDAERLRAEITGQLPAQAIWSEPQSASLRMSNLSRAYRVNLNVLAMVALFTGAFIVQATLSLRILRQQRELALIGVIGAPRRLAAWRVLIDAVLVGIPGALAGVAGGVALALLLLRLTGGDLGGGYFGGDALTLRVDVVSLIVAFAGGIAIALAGALVPLRTARAITPAIALRAAGTESILEHRRAVLPALLALAGAAALSAAPPIAGLPLASYAAIALMLVAGVALTGSIIAPCARAIARRAESGHPQVPVWLATQRLARAPASAAAMLGGVIASFALASAMAIMVTSFRVSVSEWLDQVLPADVYARLAPTAAAPGFGETLQTQLAALPGVRHTEFVRTLPLLLDPSQPPVAMIARPLESAGAGARLPLTGQTARIPPGSVPVWITEAVTDLHGWRIGQTHPLALSAATGPISVFVAGVWRDYSRQHGAIAIDLDSYRQLTGDRSANEIAWWLHPDSRPGDFNRLARDTSPVMQSMEFRDTAELKALSLKIFDRSFAITHALEAIAIAVALFGVASAVAGEALARSREFGMLRHLGLTRAQTGRQFAIEAAAGATLATLWGLLLGAAVAWILVHRVNPHSFHWTMDMHWPWAVLVTTAVAMIVLSAITARLAAREATGTSPVRAVREDW